MGPRDWCLGCCRAWDLGVGFLGLWFQLFWGRSGVGLYRGGKQGEPFSGTVNSLPSVDCRMNEYLLGFGGPEGYGFDFEQNVE